MESIPLAILLQPLTLWAYWILWPDRHSLNRCGELSVEALEDINRPISGIMMPKDYPATNHMASLNVELI
jgi:hypothetical protein